MGIRDRIRQWLGIDMYVTEAPAQKIVKPRAIPALYYEDPQNLRDFIPPDIDLTLVQTAYNTDSYVRQAVDKIVELIFKAGWSITSKNQKALDYINARLRLIAEMTDTPTEVFLMQIAENLVKYHNVIIIKSRGELPKIKGIYIKRKDNLKPITGYYLGDITTFSVKRDKYGVIKKWKQTIGNVEKTFNPEDVILITYKREPGKVFGTPFILSAISDVRALRQIEEDVLRMLYRYIFPFIHAKIGSDEEGQRGTDEEVLAFKQILENMQRDAGIVTTERVELKPVALNMVVDAYKYLQYFENRVFTALGVSQTVMGRGETASRSVGNILDAQVKERVKAYQRVIELYFSEFIIKELLYEGGFDPITKPEDDVNFRFNEIDLDNKIKLENHTVFLYEHNAITEDEMRQRLGLELITDKERQKLYYMLIKNVLKTADTDNRNNPQNQHTKKDQSFYKMYLDIKPYILNSDNKVKALLDISSLVKESDPYASRLFLKMARLFNANYIINENIENELDAIAQVLDQQYELFGSSEVQISE